MLKSGTESPKQTKKENTRIIPLRMSSPIHSAGDSHRTLVGKLMLIIGDDREFDEALELLNNRQYYHALCKLCSVTNDKTLSLVSTMLELKDMFRIDINKRQGIFKETCLLIAAKANNASTYNFLVGLGADETIKDVHGFTPAEWLRTHCPQPLSPRQSNS